MCTDSPGLYKNRLAKTRQRGVSLVELIIFIVIIGIAIVGVLRMLSISTVNSADPLRRKQAMMLAEGLLEEVQSANFTACDPTDPNVDSISDPTACAIPEDIGQGKNGEPVGTRPYDNVNDYVSAWRTAQRVFDNSAGAVIDAAGNSFGLTGYTATLAISGADALNGITSSETPAGMNVLHLTVTVTYGTGTDDKVVLDGYRTRYAPTMAAK
jgi:MSHA pilin protein MshD